MYSNAIGSNCRAKKDMKILIKPYPETGVKTYKRYDIALLRINLVILTFGEPFIDLVDPTGTGIGINVECTDLALAQMEIATVIERGGYCIYIARRIIVVRVMIA